MILSQIQPRRGRGGARGRGNKVIPMPAFHPDHPLAGVPHQQMLQAAGNVNGQRSGAPSVPQIKPQPQPQPQVMASPRPTSYREAVSGTAVARATVTQAMSQLESDKNQASALASPGWRSEVDSIFADLKKAMPTTPASASASSPSASAWGQGPRK